MLSKVKGCNSCGLFLHDLTCLVIFSQRWTLMRSKLPTMVGIISKVVENLENVLKFGHQTTMHSKIWLCCYKLHMKHIQVLPYKMTTYKLSNAKASTNIQNFNSWIEHVIFMPNFHLRNEIVETIHLYSPLSGTYTSAPILINIIAFWHSIAETKDIKFSFMEKFHCTTGNSEDNGFEKKILWGFFVNESWHALLNNNVLNLFSLGIEVNSQVLRLCTLMVVLWIVHVPLKCPFACHNQPILQLTDPPCTHYVLWR